MLTKGPGDSLHGQRNALDSGYLFRLGKDDSQRRGGHGRRQAPEPVRFLAEGRDASATFDAMSGPRPTDTARQPSSWLARAWLGVALVPVFFIVAFAVGEAAYAVLGYKPENADAPFWAVIITSVLVLLVVYIPCVAAIVYGRRCVRSGDRRGVLPLAIGSLAAAGATVLTVVSEVGDALRR